MQDDNKDQNWIGHSLRALRHKNYRLFFTGQLVSLTGTWMQHVAMGWLVYRLTNSPFALGIIGFSSQITTFFIAPFAGVWADQANRHRIVLVAQVLAMIQAFILAFLVFRGIIEVWHIVALSIFLGLISSFDMPVRQSFTIDMIGTKHDLGNAIALNSLIFNLARFIGPTIAGILVARFGEATCFFVNGVSYTAVIISLLMMKISPVNHDLKNNHILQSMKEGFMYTFGYAPMRYILMLMSLVSLVVMPYSILMPVFARDVLGGNSQTLGFLVGCAGLGALIGAFFLASRKNVQGFGGIIAVATSILGAGLVLLSLTRIFWLALCLMVFVGFGIMVHMAASNTVLQTIVDDDKRGRVMSFYIMAFIGLTPFGSLLAGGLASRIGTPNTIMISGLLCFCGVALFLSKISLFKDIVAKERSGAVP